MTTTSTHKQRQQELSGEHERRTTSSPAERLQSPPPSRDADRCPTPDSASMAARKRGHGWRAERRRGGGSLVGGRRQRRRAVDLEEDVVVVAVRMGRQRLAGSGGGGGGGGGMACTGDLTVGDRSNGQDSFPPAFFKKEPLLPLPLLTGHIFFHKYPCILFSKRPSFAPYRRQIFLIFLLFFAEAYSFLLMLCLDETDVCLIILNAI